MHSFKEKCMKRRMEEISLREEDVFMSGKCV